MDIMLDMNRASLHVNDLLVQDGDLVITPTQLDQIQQFILQRLRTFLGEWFLDLSIGLPYFQQIFVKNPDLATIKALYVNEILATPPLGSVVQLNSFSLVPSPATRQIAVSFSALTTSGVVKYEGLVPV